MSYTVRQVAQFAGVTVRTLHHYDRSGLLTPSDRSRAGYRLYDDADLARLQQILFYRALGFPLERVAAILDDPQGTALEQLRARRREHEGEQDRPVHSRAFRKSQPDAREHAGHAARF